MILFLVNVICIMLQEFFNHYAEFEGKDDFIKATSEERQRLAKEVGFIQF